MGERTWESTISDHRSDRSKPADAAIALAEPLLPLARRIRLETDFQAVTRALPGWVAAFVGGVLSDIAGTFPNVDPWRCLSARIGDLTVGEHPPASNGAVTPTGERFGSWLDATDLVPLVFPRPEIDVALTAVADGLEDLSASLVAFAHLHHSAVRAAVDEAWQQLTGVGFDAARPAAPVSLDRIDGFHDACLQAIHWVAFRRRAYGAAADDPWPVEACYRWAELASPIVDGEPVDEAFIARAISDEQVFMNQGVLGREGGTTPSAG